MKARAFVITALVLICTLLALPGTALATPPEPLTLTVDMYVTGPDSAAGTCTFTGLFEATGPCPEVFFMADDTSHGIKTVTLDGGTIIIRYQVLLTWTATGGIADGRWVVVSGTGAYEKLHGVGDTYATLDLGTGYLWAEYTGMAHFD